MDDSISNRESNHYSRQIRLDEIGESGQQILKKSSVLIIGVGGLGCPISQYLVSVGVGHIGIIDNDIVDVSNLHRQVLFDYDNLGESKVHIAKAKLQKMNPFIQISTYNFILDYENAVKIIGEYDLIIDGGDNFPTTYAINDACLYLNKPWVFGAIHGFEGHVSVFNYRDGPTYRCLFQNESDNDSCSVAGVLGTLPGIIGTLMANEAIKVLLSIGEVLTGKLLVLNVLKMDIKIHQFDRLVFEKTSSNILIVDDNITNMLLNMEQLTTSDVLVDVRTPTEHQQRNLGGINIPLSEIANYIDYFRTISADQKRIVFYCQSGARSKKAVQFLINCGFDHIFSLKEGMSKQT